VRNASDWWWTARDHGKGTDGRQSLALFISNRSSREKLIKYQANTSCVIMSVILMTTLFYKALILQGEIWCWSLLGLKGLNKGSQLNLLRLNLLVLVRFLYFKISTNFIPFVLRLSPLSECLTSYRWLRSQWNDHVPTVQGCYTIHWRCTLEGQARGMAFFYIIRGDHPPLPPPRGVLDQSFGIGEPPRVWNPNPV